MKTCNATTRNGTPCRKPPVKGRDRCRLHGGNQPRGTEHHNFRHGLYSKHVGSQLKDILNELDNLSNDELIDPGSEIKLMQALIISAKALKNDVSDLRDLDIISKVIDRLITAKQRSQAIMIEQQRLVPASDIERFLDFVESLLIDRVGEDTGYAIINEFKNFKLSSN